MALGGYFVGSQFTSVIINPSEISHHIPIFIIIGFTFDAAGFVSFIKEINYYISNLMTKISIF